jgi:hypothetical protein
VPHRSPRVAAGWQSARKHRAAGITKPAIGRSDYNALFAPLANRAFAGGLQVATGDAGAWKSGAPSSSYTAHSFEQGITRDRALMRGWALSGGKPEQIEIVHDGEPLAETLKSAIEAHGEGLYEFA